MGTGVIGQDLNMETNGQWIAISDNQLSQEQSKSGSVRDQSILIIDFIYI